MVQYYCSDVKQYVIFSLRYLNNKIQIIRDVINMVHLLEKQKNKYYYYA